LPPTNLARPRSGLTAGAMASPMAASRPPGGRKRFVPQGAHAVAVVGQGGLQIGAAAEKDQAQGASLAALDEAAGSRLDQVQAGDRQHRG
jgi:hypothetical protein